MGEVDLSMGDFDRNLGFDGSFLDDDRMGDEVAAVTDGSFLIGDVDLERDLSLSFLSSALLFSGGLSGGDDSRYTSISLMSQSRVSPGARAYNSRSN